jgi:hypothetical protein
VTGQPDALVEPGRSPALQALLAAVRVEFRGDVFVFPATDPVFGGGACRVTGCRRVARGHGLCQGHHRRWAKQGRPDLDGFAARTDPGWERQRPNRACRVPGCHYGDARGGLCQSHAQRWHRAGRPELDVWLADPPPVRPPAPQARCRVGCCELWPQASLPFCHAHAATWRANRRPDIEEFAAAFAEREATEDETVRLAALPARLRLEVQYALQCRADDRATKTSPSVVMRMVRFLAGAGQHTLLDRSEAQWRAAFGEHARNDPNTRSLLLYPSPGRRPAARRRLGPRVSAGSLAAPQARPPREPDPGLHRHSAALATGTGQAVAALAAGHRSAPGGRPPRPARAHALRRVL